MQEKQDLHRKILKDLLFSIKLLHESNPNDQTNSETYSNKQPDLDSIFQSIRFIKEPNNYRNKCEFSFGKNRSVGFRLGTVTINLLILLFVLNN